MADKITKTVTKKHRSDRHLPNSRNTAAPELGILKKSPKSHTFSSVAANKDCAVDMLSAGSVSPPPSAKSNKHTPANLCDQYLREVLSVLDLSVRCEFAMRK